MSARIMIDWTDPANGQVSVVVETPEDHVPPGLVTELFGVMHAHMGPKDDDADVLPHRAGIDAARQELARVKTKTGGRA